MYKAHFLIFTLDPFSSSNKGFDMVATLQDTTIVYGISNPKDGISDFSIQKAYLTMVGIFAVSQIGSMLINMSVY